MQTGMVQTWRRAAPMVLRQVLRRPARFVRREVLPRVVPPASGTLRKPVRDVRVVGLLSSASGVGRSGRLCIDVLEQAGYRVSTHDVSDLFAAGHGVPYAAGPGGPPPAGGVSIYHLNPPMLLPGLMRSGLQGYYRGYNVGYWAWELEVLPPEWVRATRFVDAVLVPSTFCQQAVQRATAKPVIVVPHPVPDAPAGGGTPPGESEAFRVVSVFNLDSSLERKNPLALVQAFRLAFGDDSGAELVLKVGGSARHGRELERLREAVQGAPNIRIIDEVWEQRRLEDFMRSASLYASLHRSEGFGLTLAEAIMAEVPVLATNWSGNTDFCVPDLCYPVDYELVPLSDGHTDYSEVETGRWAEPSVAHAAEQLRRVREDRTAARRRAGALKASLIGYLGSRTYPAALATLADAQEAQR